MVGQILYLTTAETDLLGLDAALNEDRRLPRVIARNLTGWGDGAEDSDDLDRWLSQAKVVVLRLLGGKKACPAVFDRVAQWCRDHATPLLAWSADGEPHLELDQVQTVDHRLSAQGMAYAALGGVNNWGNLVRWLTHHFIDPAMPVFPPREEPWTGIYWPGESNPLTIAAWQRKAPGDGPVVAIFFYRAHWLSRNIDFVDALVTALSDRGVRPLPIFCQTLKDARDLKEMLWDGDRRRVDAVVVTMSFAISRPQGIYTGVQGRPPGADAPDLFMDLGVPVFQALISLNSSQAWAKSPLGLGPVETAMNVAVPEFDGRVITVPISFREEVADQVSGHARHDVIVRRYRPLPDRVESLARLVSAWARLGRKPASERKVALILTNYPSKNSRIGNAVGLDTPASVVRILHALAQAGYSLGPPDALPSTGDELMRRIIDGGTHDADYLTVEQMRSMAFMEESDYRPLVQTLPDRPRQAMVQRWGEPPGQAYRWGKRILVAGVTFGHVFVGIQPPRQVDEDEVQTYHSPDLPPTHHYLAYYRWLRDHFRADAVVHVGKHGTLEWLPGKGIGLSRECFPDLVLEDLPNFYPFIVDDPGEGTQAKRRSHAVVVDHMVPPVMAAGLYDHLVRLQQLLDQYYQVQTLDPAKLGFVQQQIWDTVESIRLNEDLGQDQWPTDFDAFTQRIDGYLCELEAAQIRDGLHILGEVPRNPQAWAELLYALLRLPAAGEDALPAALARDLGLTWENLQEDLGVPWTGPWPLALGKEPANPVRGDVHRAIEVMAKQMLKDAIDGRPLVWPGAGSRRVIEQALATVVPKLNQIPDEIRRLLEGLEGRFIPPGPSGAPTRGMVDVLPTGRNFYSVDPQGLPTWPAWQVGQQLAERLVATFREAHGRVPDAVGIVVWGTAAMRTGGDDIAEVLALLGVRPVWQAENNRVVDLEVIPLEELGRPRVDVTVRISGFFRDAFANLITLVDRAVRLVAEREEPLEQNPVRRHWLEEMALSAARGRDPAEAGERALFRVFGSRPGTYGSGILPVLHRGDWQTQEDLARVYTQWSGFAYSARHQGVAAEEEFLSRMQKTEVATKNQDNREHDIFDSDDYLQDHGGMAATIKSLTGKSPDLLFGDSSDPTRARVRSFREEARRVYRTRVVNPRWIKSVMRHGYKGALEMANTMDFLFGYDATADLLEDWMYEGVARAYALDPEVVGFFKESNPWALKDIAERLLEAARRGLWENADQSVLEALEDTLMEIDEGIEEWGGES